MLIANRYRLTEKIYEGNCSSVYIGKNVIKKEDVIIKLEDSSRMNLLEHEAGIYLHLMKQKNKINILKFKMYGVLQKYNYIILEKMQYNFTDIIKENDLFVEPIDISDNNIPNGNSIYLIVCNKLKNITGNDKWQKKT